MTETTLSFELGKRILEARKRANLNQEQLAEKLGVTKSAISQYETGLTTPAIENAILMAKALGVSVDWLFGVDARHINTVQMESRRSTGMGLVNEISAAIEEDRLQAGDVALLLAIVYRLKS